MATPKQNTDMRSSTSPAVPKRKKKSKKKDKKGKKAVDTEGTPARDSRPTTPEAPGPDGPEPMIEDPIVSPSVAAEDGDPDTSMDSDTDEDDIFAVPQITRAEFEQNIANEMGRDASELFSKVDEWAQPELDPDPRVNMAESKKLSKAAARKKQKEENQKKADARRAAGLPPTQGCAICGDKHWTQDHPKDHPIQKDPATGKIVDSRKPNPAPQPQADTGKSKKRKNTQTSTGKSPAKKKSKSQEPETLANALNGLSTETSATSTPRPAASVASGPTAGVDKTQPLVKSHLTRRAASGKDVGDGKFADGTYVYLKLPPALRKTANPSLQAIVGGLTASGIASDDIRGIAKHDDKGMMVKCTTSDAAQELAGRTFNIGENQLILEKYHTTGARAFFTNNTGMVDSYVFATALHRAFNNEKSSAKFWLGREHFQGITGDKALIIFDTPASVYKFTVPVNNRPNERAFKVNFWAVDPGESKCSCCGETHGVLSCNVIRQVTLMGQQSIETLLLSKPQV